MRRGIVFATTVLEPLVGLALTAEAAGLDRVWTTEYPGRDAIARALAISLGTSRIGVGTGVAYAFTRPPLAMAALAADVHRLSGRRFALGISAGTRGVRRWFGADFDPPAPRMTEYVTRLREIWDDDDLYPARPPVLLPGFHPVMTRHAAAVADGLLLHPLSVIDVHLHERVLPAVAAGAASRSSPLELVAWQITSIDDDEMVARRRAAAQIAFYLSTPSYAVATQGTAWHDVPGRVRDGLVSGQPPDWRELGAIVPDDLVDALAVAGTPADVAARLDRVAERIAPLGVTELVVQTVGAGMRDEEVVENCRRLIEAAGHGEKGAADE